MSCKFTCTVADYSITGMDFKLNKTSGELCLYASFNLKFTIYYFKYNGSGNDTTRSKMSSAENLPANAEVGGSCGQNSSKLVLSWRNHSSNSNFSTTLTFSLGKTWSLRQVAFNFSFESSSFTNPEEQGMQSYVTQDIDMFNRTFSRSDYFYCERTKLFYFNDSVHEAGSWYSHPCIQNNNESMPMCSHVEMEQAVIYPGNIYSDKPNRKICMEDYIALQELIVPIVVGGVLGLLLLLILIAYVIAYVRRRRKESHSQYEPVGDY